MRSQSTPGSHDNDVLMSRPGKWTLTIITMLRSEARRFNNLKRAGGISQKTLTLTLRAGNCWSWPTACAILLNATAPWCRRRENGSMPVAANPPSSWSTAYRHGRRRHTGGAVGRLLRG